MNGIYYARFGREPYSGGVWRVHGEIVVSFHDFKKFFPDMTVSGSWQHDSECDEYDECCCTHNIRLIIGVNEAGEIVFSAEHTKASATGHQLGEFRWDWSGHGATEHWFDDEAISLKVVSQYCSNSGLTADETHIVAYKRHVEVRSFRGDCAGSASKPKLGKIWAEFVNADGEYRANWTGFAVGAVPYEYTDSNGYQRTAIRPIIGDELDVIIDAVLADETGRPVVCKHNRQVQVYVITKEAEKLPRYLCTACRLQGVRWSEFIGRNRQDVCPYFRRACKSVIGKSDPLPEWFEWQGNNLLSSHRRLQDGEWEAYEVVYVRRKEGFIRRAVWLGNTRTQEVWMYPYAGFIPRTMAAFREKYLLKNSRQIRGYLGANPPDHREGGGVTEDDFRSATEQDVLWCVNGIVLLPFDKEFPPGYEIGRGEIGNVSIVSYKNETGEIADVEITDNPRPVYTDDRYKYYGVSTWWTNSLSFHQNGQELEKAKGGKNYLLRIPK